MRIPSRGAAETGCIAREFAKTLTPGDLLCLSGELGAGKTTFLKGVISELMKIPEEEITSPTFIYLHQYKNDSETRSVYHFDLYRIETCAQFSQLGLQEYLDDTKAIRCIEWAERIPSLIPASAIFIAIRYTGEESREIEIGR